MNDTDKSELEIRHTLSYILTGEDWFTSSKLKPEIEKLQALITQQCNDARIDDIKAWDKFFSNFDPTTPIDVHSWSGKRIATILAQAKETEGE